MIRDKNRRSKMLRSSIKYGSAIGFFFLLVKKKKSKTRIDNDAKT
jgi:hypothetical protein